MMSKANSQWSTAHRFYLACLAVVVLGLTAAPLRGAAGESQQTFATPQAAIQATIEASQHNDTAALLRIFGPEGKDIVESGDPVQDKNDRMEFVDLAHEKMEVNQDPANPNRTTFSVGTEDWRFPIPLVQEDGKWRFDSATGAVEVLAHRIGENELNAMELCRGFVEAQLEYATTIHDGSGLLEYAQKFMSTPGRQDGLYWDRVPDSLVPKSFAAAASGETVATKPYHGYYFRILKAQGPEAPGGALNYVVNGIMIGGFAMIAWPAEYGGSGIKTFIVSHHGLIYEQDLGSNTAAIAKQMTSFNPDPSWHKVE
jgi:Protein of unknown function (DUF2950)